MNPQRHPLSWRVGWHADPDAEPLAWLTATVPGAVQLDWATAQGWPAVEIAGNTGDYRWMEDVFWTYETLLTPPRDLQGRLFFVCGGVDYQCTILLNDQQIHAQQGMFTPITIELTGRYTPGDRLRVRVAPAPKSVPAPDSRDQANRSCKPAMSYGWDFHPRLIPLGIWDETYLELRPATFIAQAEVTAELSDDVTQATLRLDLQLDGPAAGLRVRWELRDPDGALVNDLRLDAANRLGASIPVERPVLWWPHDQGTPATYTSLVELLDPDGAVLGQRVARIGLRRVRLVMQPGAWDEPSSFPKSRSRPPITLEINGRRIFVKGANWVSPDIFPGRLDRAAYAAQLQLVRDANLSLLRTWGGAPVPKAAFFELCDELGIMVWQEFPLACNTYPDTRDYLAVLEQEARSIIGRLRAHPALVIWCGGNELFNAWSGMTDQALALRLLNALCLALDPERPFLSTSPIEGVGHGHYVFRDPQSGEEAWGVFQRADNSAYCEFGCPGPASLAILEQIIPVDERFPPRPGGVWEQRHALGAWQPESWLYPEVLSFYFGPSQSLAELVEQGQLLQAEGYRGLFEEARRQKPQAAMALNWCLNEPWPAAANNSVIGWPCTPKPALAAISAACRPILASARIRQFMWRTGEVFDPEIWLLSDAPYAEPGGSMEVWLRADSITTHLLTWHFSAVAPNTNQRGPRAQIELPHFESSSFILELRIAGRPHLDSSYVLAYRRSTATLPQPRRLNQ